MDFEKLFGIFGGSDSQKIHDFLKETAGITVSVSPNNEVSESPTWAYDILERINDSSKKKVSSAVGSDVATAVALGDIILSNIAAIEKGQSYDQSKLILLGNPNRIINELGIPSSPNEVTAWRKRIINKFKSKYLDDYSDTKKWSSGALTTIATRLIEISKAV